MVGIVLVAHKLRMLRGDTDLLAAGDGDLLSGGRRASRPDVPERGGGNGPRDVSKVCSYGGGDHSPCPLLLGAERSARHQRDLPRRKRSRTKSGEGIPEFRGTLPLNSGKPPTVEAMGFEPTTPALQRQCSSQLSYAPRGSHDGTPQPSFSQVGFQGGGFWSGREPGPRSQRRTHRPIEPTSAATGGVLLRRPDAPGSTRVVR